MSEKVLYLNTKLENNFLVTRSDTKRLTTSSLDDQIETFWNEKMASAAEKGVSLWNGVIYRLNSWNTDNGTLRLDIGETTYKETLGTHELKAEEIASTLGKEYLANALVVTSSIITTDKKIVFGQRSSGIIEPEKIGTFGGSLDKKDIDLKEPSDIVNVLLMEFKEELGIDESEIDHLDFLGMAEDYQYYPQLHFQAFINKSFSELNTSFFKTGNAEHTSLIEFDYTPEEIDNPSGALTMHLLLLRQLN